jgi:hypothetical protein
VAAAWAAFADDTGDTGVTSLNRASVEEVANRMGWSVVPLYRLPALTDEEREALWCAVCDYNSMSRMMHKPTHGEIGSALASLFERLK